VIKFVSDLRQVGGFLREFRFPPQIKLTVTKQEVYGFISTVIQAIYQPLHQIQNIFGRCWLNYMIVLHMMIEENHMNG